MNFDAVKDCLIAEANRRGLSEYEVYFTESSEISTETLKDEISSFSSGVGGGVSFRCIVNGHMGNASTELLSEDEMKALVARAVANAENIENDDKAIFYKGSESYQTPMFPESPKIDVVEMKAIALDTQKHLYDSSDFIIDGTQTGVFVNQLHMELMNSHGLHLSNSVSMCGAYAGAVVQKDGESQNSFESMLGLNKKDFDSIADKALSDALSKINSKEVESGKYDIIISARQMRHLLSAFSSAFSAKNAQLGMSLLKGREGEMIASEKITIIDDPMRDGCPMQTPFDGEGVATYKKNVIEKGVLTTLLYDLATADKAGVNSTGNGQRVSYANTVGICPYSFYIDKGDVTEEQLKALMGDGLYITEFKGMHAGCNSVTGDFSIESAGYMVRDGKICEAVKSFTVAGNFFELLKGIEALSDTVDFGIPSGFTCYGSPDILIRNVSIAGK